MEEKRIFGLHNVCAVNVPLAEVVDTSGDSERAETRFMKHAASPYNGQFSIMPDPMHLAIPRMEIVAEMALRGEHEALNDACLAVAIIADAVACAALKADAPGSGKR